MVMLVNFELVNVMNSIDDWKQFKLTGIGNSQEHPVVKSMTAIPGGGIGKVCTPPISITFWFQVCAVCEYLIITTGFFKLVVNFNTQYQLRRLSRL